MGYSQSPHNKNLIGCKWIYKIKYNCNGEIERYKARLVVEGFSQEAGIDYQEMFAPVAKMPSLRILMSIAAIRNWNIHKLDIKNVFLYRDLSEKLYMEIPPGLYVSNTVPSACKLKKSLYDLKQAPWALVR